MIKSNIEYEKKLKTYKLEMDLNNDSVYNYLDEEQRKVIRKYYEVYTTWSFSKLTDTLLLTVDKSKIDKLKELKGDGEWEFSGMVDMLKRGGDTCELGHPLRYVYTAKNKKNGNKLKFGVHCAGDFFNLNDVEIKALLKIKEDMLSDLKDIVVIKENGLLKYQIRYEWGLLGGIYLLKGIDGVEKIKSISAFYKIAFDFIRTGLPLPKSLLKMLNNENVLLEEVFKNKDFLGIDERVERLKNSEINCISKMFSYSEFNILEKARIGRLPSSESGFFNFSTINDLEVAASIWTSRESRLLSIDEYFNKMGVSQDWDRIYRYMIDHGYKREVSDIYYCVEIMMLFSKKNIVKEEEKDRDDGIPLCYSYKNYRLNKNCYDNFDKLIDFIASREFIISIKEVSDLIDKEDKIKEEIRKSNENMMSYLKKYLEDNKYSNIRGINGVQNIILDKKLDFDDMSENQKRYVKSVYEAMKNLDNPVEKSGQSEDVQQELNRRYTLAEKPDILAKIQRLQSEAAVELPTFLNSVITTVMRYKSVTEKQIKIINDGYCKYVLGEEVSVKDSKSAGKNSIGPKKWNLMDRTDIRDKILELKRHREYSNIPAPVKSIMENILTYNSVSEKQADTVENTYRRYFR